MKVPLVCYVNNKDLTVVANKNREFIPFPIKPTCYIKKGFQGLDPRQDNHAYWEKAIDLWTHEEIEVYGKTFQTPLDCARFYGNLRDSQMVSALPFFEHILVKRPDFFLDYPNDLTPTVLSFDIEVYNKGDGSFPKAETSPIICIGYKVNDGPVQVIDCYDKEHTDENILREFFRIYEEIDPDIVVGYNCLGMTGEGFDIPYIIKRADIHGLNTTKLSRWSMPPYREKKDVREYHFYGRCIFDVFNFVLKDQSLHGIKNRKLATVAEWYKIPTFKCEEVYTTNSDHLIGTEELRKHVSSDVDATYGLFKIYFAVQKALAELLQIPFENVVNSYASFIPKIFQARHLSNLSIIPFQSNATRYKDTKFEAALTLMKRHGFHQQLWGIDATSFYPSLMRTFNLSPETVKLCNFLDKSENYSFFNDSMNLWVRVPDENFNKDVSLRIEVGRDGFLRKEMDNFFDMRSKFKKLKKSDPENEISYESQSNAVKVIMNSIFGVNGLNTAWLGDMGVAIGIAGLARWVLGSVLKYYGDHVIAYDTDGIYIDCEPDIDGINKWVAELIEKTTGMKSRVSFELKGKYAGYFHKTKNYVLKELDTEKQKFIFHGVSMKSSRAPKLYDEIIQTMSRSIINTKSESDLIELAKTY